MVAGFLDLDGTRVESEKPDLKVLHGTARAAGSAVVRSMLVHARDDAARQWYLKRDLEPNPQTRLR